MSNKNPYEIRLEVLHMAKDLILNDWSLRREDLIQDWHMKVGKSECSVPYPDIPQFPTDETIINKAKTLIEFVNTSGRSVD